MAKPVNNKKFIRETNRKKTIGPKELAVLWALAGGPVNYADTAQAIAQGESSGDPKAVGNDPGGTEGLGLWQITTGFNDDIIKKYGGRQAMFNPYKNAKAAVAIYKRQGFDAWVVYSNGTYKNFLGDAGNLKDGELPKAGVIGDPVAAVGDVVGGALEPMQQVGAFFADLAKLILTPAGWLQIGQISAGVALIFWGLAKLVNASVGPAPVRATRSGILKAAGAVNPAGKATKIAKAAV